MASFCGMHYDELKTIVTLASTDKDAEGLNIREGIELETKVTGKLFPNEAAEFAGEIFRSRDGSVRIRFLDGRGFTSLAARDGTTNLTAPPIPAVETTTDSPKVHTVVLRVRNQRFYASYRTALKGLGFNVDASPAHLPALLTFDHPTGLDRSQVEAVFEPLVRGHIKKFYAFRRPPWHKSDEWYAYEMWMEYKKEISIHAD